MKTNASPKLIVQAVENVSKEYDGNVVFRKYPEKLTKNVVRFTLRTKDASKAGSREINGRLQPKASWEVHEAVINELFKLDTSPTLYVDTINGRHINPNPVALPEPTMRVKRKYTRRAKHNRKYAGKVVAIKRMKRAKRAYVKKNDPAVLGVLNAFKYILAHPKLLTKQA